MIVFFIFSINKSVIIVHNDKNIEFFCQNLVDIALERDQCIGQSKRHYLIFQVDIAGLESHFLFFTFSDFYPIVGIS